MGTRDPDNIGNGDDHKGKDSDLIESLRKAKKAILIEPPYIRKYPPLALAKIASFIKCNGGEIGFQRRYEPSDEDLVCVTSLFTYDSAKTLDSLGEITFLNPGVSVVIGGIYASLLPDHIKRHFPNVTVYEGYSKALDACVPDYSVDWQVDPPWDSFSFVFTTRGCPNRCPYCAVSKLEPEIWINPTWKDHIDKGKPNVMISDNNLSAQPKEHIEEICEFLIGNRKAVVFDNGFDCKFMTEDMAKMLSRLKYVKHGMRMAFDRIEEDGMFQQAVIRLLDAAILKSDIMAYVLFNFNDTPKEADYRMRECVKLGIRPYPQQFTPLNATDRDKPFIGKHWTRNLVRAFRYFWLMAGLHMKHEFEQWARNFANDARMMKEDWAVWHGETAQGNRKEPMIIANAVTPDAYLQRGERKRIDGKAVLTKQCERRIRRLTPVECERLQGFPDGWTEGVSDTQRYKMMGNAVSVPVIEAIGRKIREAIDE